MPAYGALAVPTVLYPGNPVTLVDTATDSGLTKSMAFSVDQGSANRSICFYNSTGQDAVIQAAVVDADVNYMPVKDALANAMTAKAGSMCYLPNGMVVPLLRLTFAVAPVAGKCIVAI